MKKSTTQYLEKLRAAQKANRDREQSRASAAIAKVQTNIKKAYQAALKDVNSALSAFVGSIEGRLVEPDEIEKHAISTQLDGFRGTFFIWKLEHAAVWRIEPREPTKDNPRHFSPSVAVLTREQWPAELVNFVKGKPQPQ